VSHAHPTTDIPEAELLQLTAEHFPHLSGPDMELVPILKGGSDRRYYRLRKHGRPVDVIITRYTDARADNLSFFPATDLLAGHGVRVPKVHVHDQVRKLAWIEDLGALDLWAFQQTPWPERRRLYEMTLVEATKLHRLRPETLAPHELQGLMPAFTEELYAWEQGYFFEHLVLRFSEADPAQISAVREGDGLRQMRHDLGELPRALVHRDFQSQNVIIRSGEPYFIDYQGVRPGRPEYDVASLLYDPYVVFSPEERRHLWAFYQEHRSGDEAWETSDAIYARCACQRLMQALGAYGNLSLNLNKPEFLTHIPRAVNNLRHVIETYDVMPELLPLLELRQELLA
jgi:N-acetylmuramate 1-kinase